MDSMIHGGFKYEPVKKNNFFYMRQDPQPQSAPKDPTAPSKLNVSTKQKDRTVVNSPGKGKKRSTILLIKALVRQG